MQYHHNPMLNPGNPASPLHPKGHGPTSGMGLLIYLIIAVLIISFVLWDTRRRR